MLFQVNQMATAQAYYSLCFNFYPIVKGIGLSIKYHPMFILENIGLSMKSEWRQILPINFPSVSGMHSRYQINSSTSHL